MFLYAVVSLCLFQMKRVVPLTKQVVPVLPFTLSDRAGIAEKDLQFWSTFLLSAYTSTFLVGSSKLTLMAIIYEINDS